MATSKSTRACFLSLKCTLREELCLAFTCVMANQQQGQTSMQGVLAFELFTDQSLVMACFPPRLQRHFAGLASMIPRPAS
jgi:hypothetical protein